MHTHRAYVLALEHVEAERAPLLGQRREEVAGPRGRASFALRVGRHGWDCLESE